MKPGDRVRIKSGSYSGAVGRIETLEPPLPATRATVALSSSTSIVIAIEKLEPFNGEAFKMSPRARRR